ncbi:TrmH family RNA methyltransferase [Corynebacterium glyciniphilum]|uniref:TrmH family RNA methyltransferase n=1 Tax=Corynebacterium glyciniphilum TaxID=1404244 RepID=UPI0011AB7276|nr:TrmH family RNA methyltransferase [Corynebacterium glyciniphilum]
MAARAHHQTIDNPYHPVARRITDVVRRRAATTKIILIDDLQNIAQAARSGVLIDSLYTTEGRDPAAIDEAVPELHEVQIHTLSSAVTRKIFGDEKRSRIFALAQSPAPGELSDFSDGSGDVIVLDGVRLVGNIGAIIRTSAGLNAAAVILLDSGLRTVFDRRLIRASRGLVFTLPTVIAPRRDVIDYLHGQQIPVATLAAECAEPIEVLQRVKERMAIVLGSERRGVSTDISRIADYRCSIAMSDDIESLNVSVSAGIALHERTHSRCS